VVSGKEADDVRSKGESGRKQRRGDLFVSQWTLIKPLLPKQRRGGKWNDHRLMFDGILWSLRTGSPWRDLPERYGKCGSV
jgi:transposase